MMIPRCRWLWTLFSVLPLTVIVRGKRPHSVITPVFVLLTVRCQVSSDVAALATLDWSTRSAAAAEWSLAIKAVSSGKRLLRVAWELQAAGRSIVYTKNSCGPSTDP